LTLAAAAILDICSTVANVQQDLSGTKKNKTSHEFARVNVKISPTNTQSASSSLDLKKNNNKIRIKKYKILFLFDSIN